MDAITLRSDVISSAKILPFGSGRCLLGESRVAKNVGVESERLDLDQRFLQCVQHLSGREESAVCFDLVQAFGFDLV